MHVQAKSQLQQIWNMRVLISPLDKLSIILVRPNIDLSNDLLKEESIHFVRGVVGKSKIKQQ